jgi:hypothetical protein
MENRDETINKLRKVFDDQDNIDFLDFVDKYESDQLAKIVHDDFELTMSEVEQFVYRLCACGKEPVDLGTLVTGAIKLKSVATKVDLMELQKETQVFLQEREDQEQEFQGRASTTSLASLDGKQLLEIETVDVNNIQTRLEEFIEDMPIRAEDKVSIVKTAVLLQKIATNAAGGCGFVVADKSGFTAMQQRRIDFQVVDRTDEFPTGYMTERLKGMRTTDDEFVDAVKDFSKHTESDKWDDGPGLGLSKDGYILMSLSGNAVKGAVRLAGMPTPPFRWEGVGTRHLAAMAACWALRRHPSVVIVRSDSGSVHILLHARGQIHALSPVRSEQESEPAISS